MINLLRQRYMTQPHEVSIETLALCNAACTFCPYPTLDRKGTRMPDLLVQQLLAQMQSWTEPFFISPFKVNEPLLDHRLEGFCRIIEDEIPQARIRLFTNGQPLTERQVDWIAKLKRLEHLWVSLNSTDPQEYGELMKCSFSIVSAHLDRLHKRVVEGAFPHTVVLSRVVQSTQPGQLAPTDAAFHRECLTRWPRFFVQLIKRDAWLGHVLPSDARVPQSPCARWFELSITAEGKAVLCCMDGKGEYIQGDAAAQPLLDIYNSPESVKRRHANDREGLTPCASCSY